MASRVAIIPPKGPPTPPLLDPIDPPETPEIGPAIVAVDIPSGLYSDTGTVDPLTLPADLTEKNIRLFADEILPFAQPLGDTDYRGFDARAVAAE